MVERHDDHNSAAQKIDRGYPDLSGCYPGFSDGLGWIHIPNIQLFAPDNKPDTCYKKFVYKTETICINSIRFPKGS